jgi:hypothetical protein
VVWRRCSRRWVFLVVGGVPLVRVGVVRVGGRLVVVSSRCAWRSRPRGRFAVPLWLFGG